MKKLQSQHHKSTHSLEERLRQEEDTVTAMRQAVKGKEDELKQYKVSTRDVSLTFSNHIELIQLTFSTWHMMTGSTFYKK